MDGTISQTTYRVVLNVTIGELNSLRTIVQREVQDQDPNSAEGQMASAVWAIIKPTT